MVVAGRCGGLKLIALTAGFRQTIVPVAYFQSHWQQKNMNSFNNTQHGKPKMRSTALQAVAGTVARNRLVNYGKCCAESIQIGAAKEGVLYVTSI